MTFLRKGQRWFGGGFGRTLVAAVNASRSWIDNGDGTWTSNAIVSTVTNAVGAITRNWAFVSNPAGGAFDLIATANNNTVTVTSVSRPGTTTLRCDASDTTTGPVRSNICTIT